MLCCGWRVLGESPNLLEFLLRCSFSKCVSEFGPGGGTWLERGRKHCARRRRGRGKELEQFESFVGFLWDDGLREVVSSDAGGCVLRATGRSDPKWARDVSDRVAEPLHTDCIGGLRGAPYQQLVASERTQESNENTTTVVEAVKAKAKLRGTRLFLRFNSPSVRALAWHGAQVRVRLAAPQAASSAGADVDWRGDVRPEEADSSASAEALVRSRRDSAVALLSVFPTPPQFSACTTWGGAAQAVGTMRPVARGIAAYASL